MLFRQLSRKEEDEDKVRSTWKIDGTEATEKKVHELTAAFDIQLDNLCQFLPQVGAAAAAAAAAAATASVGLGASSSHLLTLARSLVRDARFWHRTASTTSAK